MFGCNGSQAALGHDSTHPGRCTGADFIGELFEDSAVAIAPPMNAKNTLNVDAHILVAELGLGGVAAW